MFIYVFDSLHLNIPFSIAAQPIAKSEKKEMGRRLRFGLMPVQDSVAKLSFNGKVTPVGLKGARAF